MSWKISQITIKGIKGVLDKAGDFDLSNNKSIAVFGRNSSGKSGYADAIEYLFSPDGEVEHLGKGGANSERGGKHAIIHVLAAEKGITPEVSVTLHRSGPLQTITATRKVTTGRVDPFPAELDTIVRNAPAHRILRQHDLRRFVVDMDPRAKYSELSRWLGLTRLQQVHAHLTTTENELKKVDPDREFEERLKDVAKHTGGEINIYDRALTLNWCANAVKKILASPITISSLADLDYCIELLKKHRDELVQRSGKMTENYTAKVALEKYVSDLPADNCQFKICENSLENAIAAEQKVARVHASAKDSIFQEVWDSAKNLLEKQKVDLCPVCLTPWDKTQTGSQTSTLVNINNSLIRLIELAQAQTQQKEAISSLRTETKNLEVYLRNLETESNKLLLSNIVKQVSNLISKVDTLRMEDKLPTQSQTGFKELIQECRKLIKDELSSKLRGVVIQGVPESAEEADRLKDHLSVLKETLIRFAELQRKREEYRKIRSNFSAVATAIQKATASLLNEVIEALKKDLESLYETVHPDTDIPRIYLKPDVETKTLILRVDFHSLGRTVPPAGYLSESHINTIGLALFITCARIFNSEFPFIFLDDIVSSYDADHRARIADLIAEELGDFQVFLTTHDEMFYSILKSRLANKGWIFERITGWSLNEGPTRESEALKPEEINILIQRDDPNSGNALRQYMEEWLDNMCAKYYAYTLHKRPTHEFDRTLFDYWWPFIDRLKKIKGNFFTSYVDNQPCYQRLSTHSIMNYYSHWQANPYKWGSKGDVEYIWQEFQAFEKLFCCSSCSKILNYEHDLNNLYCTCGNKIFPPEV